MLTKNIRFEKITSDKGLSNNVVNSIIQDSQGFLWLGTMDGLNRYDGEKFHVFKKKDNENSIPNNYIQSIFEDSKKNIWIGTANLGLTVYRNESNTFMRILLNSTNYHNSVTDITEDKYGNIWVGTYGSGLFKINNFNITEHFYKSDPFDKTINCDIINSMLYDKETNKLYVGGWSNGISVLDLEKMEFSYLSSDKTDMNSLCDNRIKFIFKGTGDDIWITTHFGLTRYNERKNLFTRYLHDDNNINSLTDNVLTGICEDKNGVMWIGTRNHGINSFIVNDNKFTRYNFNRQEEFSLPCDQLLILFIDRTNVLWMGSWGEGLCKLDRSQKKFGRYKNINFELHDEKANKISSIYRDSKQDYWLGTQTDGLYKARLENDELKSEKFHHVGNKLVSSIIEDNEKQIWFSTQLHGLCSLNLTTNEFQIHKDSRYDLDDKRIISLLNDKSRKNIMWIGAEFYGLIEFDRRNKSFTENIHDREVRDITIFSLFQNSEGNLWIGSHGYGLLFYDPIKKNIIKKFLIPDDSIWCINEDCNETIWIGTLNGGLYKLEKNQDKLINYNEDHGLTNNCVYGILFDENNHLWLSTEKGLSKFDTRMEKFLNYDFKDGLQGNDFNVFSYYKSPDNVLHFGGMNGITFFKPEEIQNNVNIPNIVLTDFEIFNQTVIGSPENPFLKRNITHADEINLTYKESVFSFRFAALIFNNPQKNQYAYKMENFDKDWTYCQNRKRVTYTNLNPGEYVFRVKGSNNDGVWNEEGTSIKIHISPPYWKTWWFKGLGFLSLVAATGYSYRQRLEKLEKETKAQAEFSRKLIESQENERKRIAHELHDTLAHDVLISKNKALMALRHKDDKEGLEKTLEEISELATSTITDIRNISYDLHPHQLEKLGFTKTIRSIINEVSKSTNINFTFETDNVDEVLSKETEINLFRIIQESISNIIKHSKATEAILNVSRFEDYLLIVIIDNGKGFDVSSKEFAEARQGFGLSGIAERLKFMNGEAKVESEINKGTTLKFKIPMKSK